MRRILDVLVAAWPRSVSRQDLVVQAGFEEGKDGRGSGTFSRYLSQLRGLNLVVDSAGGFKAADPLFPTTWESSLHSG